MLGDGAAVSTASPAAPSTALSSLLDGPPSSFIASGLAHGPAHGASSRPSRPLMRAHPDAWSIPTHAVIRTSDALTKKSRIVSYYGRRPLMQKKAFGFGGRLELLGAAGATTEHAPRSIASAGVR